MSVTHAARFLLVGTMNPEEGELRPQLLDRFGLAVEVRAARDVDTRVEVVRRRMAFEADPETFAASWADAERSTAEAIEAAQQKLPAVGLPDAELRRIASVCAAFEVDGMRADLVIAHAARAHAALRGAAEVDEEDVRVAARLALPHRRRRDPFDEPGIDEQALEDALDDAAEPPDDPPEPPDGGGAESPEQSSDSPGGPADRPAGDGASRAAPPPGTPFRARLLQVPGLGEGAPGKRSRARTDSGRVVRATGSAPAPRRRPAPARHRGGGRAERPAQRADRGWRCRSATCAAPSARAARATSCSSPSTRPARWPRGNACPR